MNEKPLSTSHDRIHLLRAGFMAWEIEKLYVMLNSFETTDVTWSEVRV